MAWDCGSLGGGAAAYLGVVADTTVTGLVSVLVERGPAVSDEPQYWQKAASPTLDLPHSGQYRGCIGPPSSYWSDSQSIPGRQCLLVDQLSGTRIPTASVMAANDAIP